MIVGMTILAQGQPKERLAWIFRIYDQNGDGYIDMNELNVTIHAILAMTDENFDKNKDNLNEIITKIANSLAKNDPEKINSNEFVEGILSHPYLMDLMCPKNI
jgi:Ca2+-binding EF-hand superfamily protein